MPPAQDQRNSQESGCEKQSRRRFGYGARLCELAANFAGREINSVHVRVKIPSERGIVYIGECNDSGSSLIGQISCCKNSANYTGSTGRRGVNGRMTGPATPAAPK